MGVIRRKIWTDLWTDRARTLRVVLIIAMGAFAIGMVIGTRDTIINGMETLWRESSPAMIHLWAAPSIDDETVAALERIDGVAGVEGFAQTRVEWRLSAHEPWSPATLTARDNYEHQQFATLDLLDGEWPQRRMLAVGQGSDTAFGIQPKSEIEIRVDDRERVLDVGGVIYDPNVQPPGFGGQAQLYVDRDQFADLTGDRGFSRILAVATHWDEPWVASLADEMQERLERQGVASGGFAPPSGQRLTGPDKHFFQDVTDGLFFILGVMAVFALILGLLLVYNTVSATITRQIDQIGIMKAVGATRAKILCVYLLNVLTYGGLALLLALPLGVIGAHLLGGFLLDAFNVEGGFEVSVLALVAQVIIALLSPLVAGFFPVLAGARVTVQEAIRTYGLAGGTGLLERLLARLRFIPRVISLILGNTFRHKRRVLLTQVTLALSGMIFMTVMGARETAIYTFDELVPDILRFNVNLQLERPERIGRIESVALDHPQVESVEVWALENATARSADQPESNDDRSVTLLGIPPVTNLYGPQMRSGRWLALDDQHATVLSQRAAADIGAGIGDRITLNHGRGNESQWIVVGILFDPIFARLACLPRDVLLGEIHSTNQARTIWVQTTHADGESEAEIAAQLRERYERSHLELVAGGVFGSDTSSDVIGTLLGQFDIIVTLLATMAVVIGVVGSIALGGTLSLNVLDRRREIGVLKAIGATSRTVAFLSVGEGMLLGWLSWLIALPISIPASKVLVAGLSAALGLDLVYRSTLVGPLSWLIIITLLSVVASWFPARSAVRVPVREALVYE